MNFVAGDKDEAIESEIPALEQLVFMGYDYKSQAELNKEIERYFTRTRCFKLITILIIANLLIQ